MGYNSTAATLTLTAKLTPLGRQRFVTNTNNTLITSFRLGDSDANYYASNLLTTGQVPAEAGEIGPFSGAGNSTISNAGIKSFLIATPRGGLSKLVESQSNGVNTDILANGQVTVSADSLTFSTINRADYNTDSLVNLFYSFGLPITTANDTLYTGTTFEKGGYADTALSGIAQTKILAIGIDNSTYGESLDGKQIMLTLQTSAATYTIYSTYQNKGANLKVEDVNYRETSPVTANIDSNIAMLFCDTIATPNQDPSLSWATGFGLPKPFSLNKKQLYNLQTNSNTSTTADTVVGVAYLDKGFLVITHPTIVAAYTASASTATTVTFDSVSTNVYQNITCIANRGEFGGSTNPTFSAGDVARITEIGLYDSLGNLVAIAKTDCQVPKNTNEFVAFGIKINL
jgi:hypothetical protein